MGRADAPLVAAPDATVIDTSDLSIPDALERAAGLVARARGLTGS
jgi:cytidylate kinase